MQLIFRCPACNQQAFQDVSGAGETIHCGGCGWSRMTGELDFAEARPARCLVCGCDDLWRQKDFPQRLGLLIVGMGILCSTIAWAYMRPLWAIGILMLFALADMVLHKLMSDVLVCYRCGGRHRHAPAIDQLPVFNHETAERHRQEAKRLNAPATEERPV